MAWILVILKIMNTSSQEFQTGTQNSGQQKQAAAKRQ
jgi:hypothetical protein